MDSTCSLRFSLSLRKFLRCCLIGIPSFILALVHPALSFSVWFARLSCVRVDHRLKFDVARGQIVRISRSRMKFRWRCAVLALAFMFLPRLFVHVSALLRVSGAVVIRNVVASIARDVHHESGSTSNQMLTVAILRWSSQSGLTSVSVRDFINCPEARSRIL